jgi:hypothetical protein
MRRAFGIGALILIILMGVAIGVGAYHAGVTHGLAQAADGGRIVRVVGPEEGFFPFGLFLFPLFFFLVLFLARGLFWRRRWYGNGSWGPDHHGGPGPWSKGGPAMFEEWHRHQHESQQEGGSTSGAGSGTEPAGV